MPQSLIIKDGVGAVKNLTVESGSYGFMPIHYVTSSTSAPVYITASSANPLPVTGTISVDVVVGDIINVTASLTNPTAVTGTVNVNNAVLTVTSSLASPVYAYAYSPAVTTVAASSVNSFNWAVTNGTFAIAAASSTRRGLTVFNPGPYNLYVALATSAGANNGFTIVNTASAPSQYSFIVYPSGTYTADPTTVGVYHGGYFISGSASVGVFISAIS